MPQGAVVPVADMKDADAADTTFHRKRSTNRCLVMYRSLLQTIWPERLLPVDSKDLAQLRRHRRSNPTSDCDWVSDATSADLARYQ
jgi:hypothetical protein